MASAVIGALRVNLGIDSAQFQDGLKKAQQSLAGIGKSMTRVGAGLSAAVTAPVVGFGVAMMRTAGDFEAAMNRVGAATGSTGAELEAMSALARQLGKDTTKSASESADMLEMLAKNGLSAEQILSGAAASAIALSEATGGDLSRSADVATNVMAQFRLEVKDLPRIVDQITASTLNSQFGFDEYSQALAQAGGVAGGLGVSIEDFNAVITATADTFNSGSDAGTSFKTFLLSLTPTTAKARGAMEDLGLEFFNANGSMKSMAEIAEELRTSMSGLSDTEMSENMKTIFGTDSMRTAIALMNQGAEGINTVREGIERQGVAAEQQAARMQGFNGEMEKLSGAFDELKLAIAGSGILEAITQLATKLAEWTDYLAETNPEMLKWGTVIAGLAAALGPVVLSIGLLATGIAAIGAPVALAVAGVAALTAGIVAFWPEIQRAAAAVAQFATDLVSAFTALPDQMMEIGRQIMDGLWQGLKNKFASVRDGIANFASDMVNGVKSRLGIHSPSRVMHEVGVNVMQGLGDGIDSMSGAVESTASSIGNTIANAFQGLIDGSKNIKDVLKDLASQLSSMLMNEGFRMLFGAGGGGGSGGGFLGGLFSGAGSWFKGLLGFQNGGSFQVGGAGGIDSQLVAFRASPNEHVSITKPGQERHGGTVNVAITGTFVDDNGVIKAQVTQMGQQAAQAGAAVAVSQVKQSMPQFIANAQTRSM